MASTLLLIHQSFWVSATVAHSWTLKALFYCFTTVDLKYSDRKPSFEKIKTTSKNHLVNNNFSLKISELSKLTCLCAQTFNRSELVQTVAMHECFVIQT